MIRRSQWMWGEGISQVFTCRRVSPCLAYLFELYFVQLDI